MTSLVDQIVQPTSPEIEEGDGEETTTDSQPETETDEGAVDEGKATDGQPKKPLPFHKHPEWIKREETWNKRVEELQTSTKAEIEALKTQIETKKAENKELTEADIPDWFNGDLDSFKKFDSYQNNKLAAAVKAAEDGAVTRIKGETTQQTKAQEEATSYFRTQLEEIEQDANLNPSGTPFTQEDKEALMKIARDNDLIDSKQRWNWKAAARLLAREQAVDETDEEKEEKQKLQTQKKNIAAITNRRDSKGTGTQKALANHDSLKNVW